MDNVEEQADAKVAAGEGTGTRTGTVEIKGTKQTQRIQAKKKKEEILDQYHDVCIIGAGLSGSVIAERFANVLQQKVLIIDKRSHIGGNCYDYIDDETDIRVNLYGAHLFHTNEERVWDYVHKFSQWTPYEHTVLGYVNGTHVPIPVNIDTVNKLFNANVQSSVEMDEWLRKEQVKYEHDPSNSEEMAKSRVGERLYELMFKHYTYKQWAKYPEELGPEVTARIPVRNDHDNRYFPNDIHQALPTEGYTKMFENMIYNNPRIDVLTDTDYFEIKDGLKCGKTFYTGPVDAYFAHLGWPKLEYRSLDFERKVARETDFFQPNSVVNHPSTDNNFTRIVEYKHFLHQKSPHTVYFIERSKDGGEPYYPVPNQKNKDLYKKYQEMAQKEESKGVHFVGRLANYKYFNMDQAIKNALELFDKFGGVDGGGDADDKVPSKKKSKQH